MQFIECEDGDSWATVAREGLIDFTVRVEYADRAPEIRYVVGVEHDGMMVCETEDDGSPYRRSDPSLVPWDEMTKVVIL